jgi:hypothetical protein
VISAIAAWRRKSQIFQSFINYFVQRNIFYCDAPKLMLYSLWNNPGLKSTAFGFSGFAMERRPCAMGGEAKQNFSCETAQESKDRTQGYRHGGSHNHNCPEGKDQQARNEPVRDAEIRDAEV